jgi:hypothetical protein
MKRLQLLLDGREIATMEIDEAYRRTVSFSDVDDVGQFCRYIVQILDELPGGKFVWRKLFVVLLEGGVVSQRSRFVI